jgi:hypothetical protein
LLRVIASREGRLDAWIDFNANGDWSDTREQIYAGAILAGGPNDLAVAVSAGAAVGINYTHFRLSLSGGFPPTGPAPDGEVQDHPMRIEVGEGALSIRGDCNGDGGTEGVADAFAMLTANFIGGIDLTCRAACDANGDGDATGVTDTLLLLTWNFLGSVDIHPPYPGCGPLIRPGDPALGCEREFAGCR